MFSCIKLNHFFSTISTILNHHTTANLTQTQPLNKMSVTKQVVKLLSAKYNFSFDEAFEYVTTQINAKKSMTKEEKAELRKQEQEAARAAKIQAKEDAKAAKIQAKEDAKAAKIQAKADAKAAKKSKKDTDGDAPKEDKPKKPRTEAQIAATTKMIEANKLKKMAKEGSTTA